MSFLATPEARLALSLALGLLLGVERERRNKEKGEGAAIAGLRTFGLVGLLGGIFEYAHVQNAMLVGSVLVGLFAIAGYAVTRGSDADRGLTTEVALVLTYVLGGLALHRPTTAGAAAVGVTMLLHLRTSLHRLVRDALTEREVRDGLLFLVFAFVLLPLAPDIPVGPYGALNPQRLARMVVVIMTVTGAGYASQRAFGARFGLVASGFAAGFVSSSATIAAMGLRAKDDPKVTTAAIAGGLASSVATVVLFGVLVATVDQELLLALAWPLGLALAAAVAATAAFAARADIVEGAAPTGRAFSPLPALAFAAGVAVVSIVSAAVSDWQGDRGIVVISAIAAVVDAQSTTGSIASMHQAGHISTDVAILAVVTSLTANTGTKILMASGSRHRPYAWRMTAGVVAIAAAAWLGVYLRAALG